MKIYHSIFALFFVCFSFFDAAAQSISIKRSIKWETSLLVAANPYDSTSNDKLLLMSFKDAIYPDHKHFLPYYSELIRIDTIASCDKLESIEVTESSDCTQSEIAKLTDKLPSNGSIDFSFQPVCIKKLNFITIQFLPFYIDTKTRQYKKVISVKLHLSSTKKVKGANTRTYTNSSVLSSGKWFKFKIVEDGMYKLTFDELRSLGFSSPENVRVYGNGGGMLPEYNNVKINDDLQEVGVLIKNESLIFYAKGPNKWFYDASKKMLLRKANIYSNYSCYFLTDRNSGISRQLPEAASPSAIEKTVKQYIYAQTHEKQDTNILNSGQKWFGEMIISGNQKKIGFKLPSIDPNSKGRMCLSLIGRSQTESSYSLFFEDYSKTISLPSVDLGGLGKMYSEDEQVFEYTQSNTTPNITLKYNSSSYNSNAWLDYITINASCPIQKTDSELLLNYIETSATGSSCRFFMSHSKEQPNIWNVSDYPKIENIKCVSTGTDAQFETNTKSQLNQYIIFNETDKMLKPITSGNDVGWVANQDLHALNKLDMIIVSYPSFYEQAKEIERIHTTYDHLKIATVTTEQVYNEFSSGSPDASAIRNFVKMFYDRAQSAGEAPRYLLLMGDGSFDNFNKNNFNTNYIPVYESPESSNKIDSYASDDYYGMLDDSEGSTDGMLDIGIGRLPVKSVSEASTMVKKIESYLSNASLGDWRNVITFIGDNGDYNLHTTDADKLSTLVKTLKPNYNLDKIYLDAYPEVSIIGGKRCPEANTALANRINKGSLLVNYSGHGNENQLSAYQIITRSDILSWSNASKLPIFMTATCEFSRFDEYRLVTGGETLVLRPEGGAIAMFTTTRLVFQSENFRLNTAFYNYLFNENSNGRLALGDILSMTKNSLGTSTNKLNFTLLGDPALHPALPKNNVSITSINGKDPNAIQDTVKALSKLVIRGEVNNDNNQRNQNFNGELDITVYDKPESVTTLNNKGEGAFTYESQNSILYKGKASVAQGTFSVEFIIPRDINYSYGKGKISLYAQNQSTDASGFTNNMVIGGISNNSSDDKTGPEIKLYLNDSSFVFGGTATPNSKLIASLSDQSGINTAGRGIGHDISAILDGNTAKEIILNDYYTASLNNYKKGRLEYYFKDLSVGLHTLKLKAWDVNNNSTEAYLEFYVSDVSELRIEHLLNYPNPFTTHTDFFFEHNQIGKKLDIQIQIFTTSGKLIKTIDSDITSMGSRSEPIPWDGKDDFGDLIGRGVYIYKIKVSTDGMQAVHKIEKLLILR